MNELLGKIVKCVVTALSTDMYGVLVDLLEKLTSLNSEIWKEELKKFLRKENCWGNLQTYVRPGFTILDVPATAEDPYTPRGFFGSSSFLEIELKYKYADLESELRPASRVEFISSFSGSFRELFPVGGQRKTLDEYCFTPDQVADILGIYHDLLYNDSKTKYLFLVKQEDEYAVFVCGFKKRSKMPECVAYPIKNRIFVNEGYMMVAIPVSITQSA